MCGEEIETETERGIKKTGRADVSAQNGLEKIVVTKLSVFQSVHVRVIGLRGCICGNVMGELRRPNNAGGCLAPGMARRLRRAAL